MPSANLGNEMICEATRRIISRLPMKYHIEEFSFLKAPHQEELDRINACQRAVFVGTNIFQANVVGWKWRTQDLKQIRIPYSLWGVGYSGPVGSMPLQVCRETRDLISWSRKAMALGVRRPSNGSVAQTARGEFGTSWVSCPRIPDSRPGISLGEGRPVLAVRGILLHNPDQESGPAQRTLVNWFFKEYPNGSCVVQERADLGLLSDKPTITEFDEIVSELSTARFVVSTRLHAGMLALAFGRPVVFIAPDTRIESFCDMIGTKSSSLTFDGLSQAVETAKKIDRGDLSEFRLVANRVKSFVGRLHDFLESQMTGTQTRKMPQPNRAAIFMLRARTRWLNS